MIAAAMSVAAACSSPTDARAPAHHSRPPIDTATRPATTPSAVLVGSGDIASCATRGDEATAALLDRIRGTVFTLGDNAYGSGSSTQYAQCYAPSWGRHKRRTRPSPGNHDYFTSGAAGYFRYFGAAAGPAGVGYYSYDLKDWHIISLNSNADMRATSRQVAWLEADLAAHRKRCTLAYWHHPLFSSGSHGNDGRSRAVWQVLHREGVDVVLNGHDHDYERFAPQRPDGTADATRGIREFVAGLGGHSRYGFTTVRRNSQKRYNAGYGVLKLELFPASYRWSFVGVDGRVKDSGEGRCH